MNVAVLSGPGELTLRERERPEPGADEVLVRMGAVGICGSDLHYYEHGRIGDYVSDKRLASIRATKADELGRFEKGIVLERVEERDSASRSSNRDHDE